MEGDRTMKERNGKNTYDSIEIPDELNDMVTKTIASMDKERIRAEHPTDKAPKKSEHRFAVRRYGIAAAAVLICSTIGLNTNPAFARQMSELPIIGTLAQVLTIRSFHGTEGDVSLDLEIPEIKLDASMPKKVNDTISAISDAYIETAKAEFAEYKEGFFADGGTKEEWAGRDMSVYIDYNVKYNTEDILSLELITAKGWVSAEEEHHFYTIDLKHDKALTPEGILGKDYINICNESILSQIKERMAEDKNAQFFGFGEDDNIGGEKFTTITPETKFYVNAEGNVVIVFDRYEIAPGSMGTLEFEIAK